MGKFSRSLLVDCALMVTDSVSVSLASSRTCTTQISVHWPLTK